MKKWIKGLLGAACSILTLFFSIVASGIWKTIITSYFKSCLNNDDSCITSATINIVLYILGISFIVFIIGLIVILYQSRQKEKYFILIKKDLYPTNISITNNNYPIIENCFVKFSKLYGLNNQYCREIANNTIWDTNFCWEKNLKTLDIPKNKSENLVVFNATEGRLEFVFQEGNVTLAQYQNARLGQNARKARYQIELKFFGTIKDDDNHDRTVQKKLFLEIKCTANKNGFISYGMQIIPKLKTPNTKGDIGEQASVTRIFKININGKDNS
jgi:hypothetical protein